MDAIAMTTAVARAAASAGEDSVWPEHQHDDEDAQGHQRGQVRALRAQVAARVAERDAEQEPADDRPGGAVEAADHRRGEAEHEDRVHAVGVEER
jgi:hypothetical protein